MRGERERERERQRERKKRYPENERKVTQKDK
jgi:hypothetical protein